MSENEVNLERYLKVMALARTMLKRGIITEKEFGIICTTMAERFGIKNGSLYR